MKRSDGRKDNQLRKLRVTKNYTKHADGAVLIEAGETRVICTAIVEESVPPFLKNTGNGWVTAEYGMLPSSCAGRIRRNNTSGRIFEIQRLIGRSLRSVVDMSQLGERTVKIDCDVIQADGGTRTASISGAFIALALALQKMYKNKLIATIPLRDYVAAVSVGVYQGSPVLDLNYEEDSSADMDMNVVMLGKGDFVEVQGTAEREPFSKKEMDSLLKLAQKGIEEIIALQQKHLPHLKLQADA